MGGDVTWAPLRHGNPAGNKTSFDVALVECWNPVTWNQARKSSLYVFVCCARLSVCNYDWSRKKSNHTHTHTHPVMVQIGPSTPDLPPKQDKKEADGAAASHSICQPLVPQTDSPLRLHGDGLST